MIRRIGRDTHDREAREGKATVPALIHTPYT